MTVVKFLPHSVHPECVGGQGAGWMRAGGAIATCPDWRKFHTECEKRAGAAPITAPGR